MTLMARLERAFGRYAIPDLTLYLVCGQAGLYIAWLANPHVLDRLAFIPSLVLYNGEWWRLLTFPFFPPTTNVLFIIFFLWFLFFMGRALEANWGTFRYNVYLLIAYAASVGAAFLSYSIAGDGVATSVYFTGSIFLAFAQLYPEFVIYLYLILPIKAKWLAWATWALYGYSFVTTDSWMTRALIIASVLNFLLFFAADIVQAMKTGRRRMHRQLQRRLTEPSPDAPFHTCAACGITDRTHPKMDFRYCPGCGGQLAYCTEHLNAHEHRALPPRRD
jgi:hypothetical protein